MALSLDTYRWSAGLQMRQLKRPLPTDLIVNLARQVYVTLTWSFDGASLSQFSNWKLAFAMSARCLERFPATKHDLLHRGRQPAGQCRTSVSPGSNKIDSSGKAHNCIAIDSLSRCDIFATYCHTQVDGANVYITERWHGSQRC